MSSTSTNEKSIDTSKLPKSILKLIFQKLDNDDLLEIILPRLLSNSKMLTSILLEITKQGSGEMQYWCTCCNMYGCSSKIDYYICDCCESLVCGYCYGECSECNKNHCMRDSGECKSTCGNSHKNFPFEGKGPID